MKTWILATLVFCGSAHAGGFPALGGNSGGGGMLAPPEPMDEAELSHFIRERIPRLARMYFNYVYNPTYSDESPARWLAYEGEAPNGEEALNVSTYQKVFLGSSTIFDVMDGTRIVLQNEPCFDPVSKEAKDASANADTNQLCFNVKGLLEKTPVRTLRSRVLALAIHEYSHLKQTSEEEAAYIERAAQLAVAVDGVAYYQIEGHWEGVGMDDSLYMTTRTLADEVAQLNSVALAFRVGELGAKIESRLVEVIKLIAFSGLSGWNADQRAKSIVAYVKADGLLRFKCSLPQIQASPERQGCEPMNGMRDNISVEELAGANGTHFASPVNAIVRDTSTGDRAKLKAELEDLVKLLGVLFKDPTK